MLSMSLLFSVQNLFSVTYVFVLLAQEICRLKSCALLAVRCSRYREAKYQFLSSTSELIEQCDTTAKAKDRLGWDIESTLPITLLSPPLHQRAPILPPPPKKKKARLRSKCACTVFFAKTPKNHRHEILSALSSFYKRPNFAETMSLSSRPKRSRVLLSWVLFAEKHIPPAHVTVKQAYRTM